VRKIISIVLALAVVLSLSMIVTAPAAAKVNSVHVAVSPSCACSVGVYNITFNATASLTEGVHSVCIAFPAGTTFHPTGGTWKDGYIMIGKNGTALSKVFGSEVTVTGTTVCFLVPKDFVPPTDNPINVVFTSSAGVANPCTPGKYQLSVYTDRAPDSTPVLSNKYTIVPCYSSYEFLWDSSPTYPGIAEDFVPPFKAGGQANNATLGIGGAVAFSGGYLNAFNLTFDAYPVGCFVPCTTVDIYVSLTASPQFPCVSPYPSSKVTLNLTNANNSSWTLATKTLTWNPCTDADGVPDEILIANDVPLTTAFTTTWAGLIGFDTVGAYTICFSAVCPGIAGAPCELPTTPEESVLVQRCIDFNVYQDKDAHKIILDEKWNLISLPLVPFNTDIDTILSAADLDLFPANGVSDLISIWSYDRCADAWTMYPGGGLTSLVNGKSYWVRMPYPITGNYTLWVFGTAKAMPPAAPLAYAMCPGWNMFGFTEMGNMLYSGYFWNFGGTPLPPAPLVYGWNNTGDWTTSGWKMIVNPGGTLVSGQGYFGYFPTGGIIVPP
jgi:hypothetical protein